ncbi:MAG: S8 family peptidase [Pseudomonadota bacterium]
MATVSITKLPHLSLPLIVRARARLNGGGKTPPQEAQNKANRQAHGALLSGAINNAVAAWGTRRQDRSRAQLPPLPPTMPLFVQVEPGSDLEYLRKHFNLEIVSEHDDGVVLVASADQDMSNFLETTKRFVNDVRGGATAAKIYGLSGPENPQRRLDRLLSESLLEKWHTITDAGKYIVDVGVECLGTVTVPEAPEQDEDETDEHFQPRIARWKVKWRAAEAAWDDLMGEREFEFVNFVNGYSGEVLEIVHQAPAGVATLPDSFTMRIRISGIGLRDIALNYPYLFEITEPDDVADVFGGLESHAGEIPDLEILTPDENAPAVCVIDSGMQERHPLLESAIDRASSTCIIPGLSATDVGDYVKPGGHGTRVAGAILFPKGIPTEGSFQAPCWLQNARVLDADNRLPHSLYPPLYMRAIVEEFHNGTRSTRLFNHSIAAYRPCRIRNMSAWAAAIDWLSWEYDILFFQSAGNLPISSSALPFRLGVLDHVNSGFTYPDYLIRNSSRIPSPSESLQAITVGSVSHAEYIGEHVSSFASEGRSSAFSTTGLGVWDSIKPDVVEYAGDFAHDGASPLGISTPPEVCPDLVRSTMHGGPITARDDVGTSFAAPKVAAIGVALQALLPDAPALLYRALIVNSARWPLWAENSMNKLNAIRQLGFGIPNVERATQNTEFRVSLITSGEHRVKSKEAHIFQVPIPEALRSPGEDFNVRIDLTLSYVAKPRRTRRNIRQYLSTWVDWKSSDFGETVDSFRNRVLWDGDRSLRAGEGTIPWKIREKDDWGDVQGVRRGTGTVQKDWAILKSHQLPTDFCVAVIGHPGWDKDPDATAKYALTISFEAIDEDIKLYTDIAASIETVITIPEIELELQV